MEADAHSNVEVPDGPEAFSVLEDRLHDAVRSLVRWVREENTACSLWAFEKALLLRIGLLYQLAVALFIAVRREGLDLEQSRAPGWRIKRPFARRSVQTFHGPVTYGRAYVTRRQRGGWFPLDAALGITRDGFSWRVIDVVTRLATRLSYASVQQTLRELINWSPSPEAIEMLTMGLGQRAPAFMETQGRLDGDGDVLVIEVDGKAAPMVTESELAARRRPRQKEAGCKCQRHRRRQRRRQRQAATVMKRKKRGHNSKNGRSATLVAMYTLRRGSDGKLHGPTNKKIWGQFGTRKAALEWARTQATRRGFGPDTSLTVQIVIDGEKCLRQGLEQLFRGAVITLDIRHAQERLWKVGRQFHEEGSAELQQWVEPHNRLLLNGEIDALLKRLRQIRASIPQRGPNTRAKRDVLDEQLAYFSERKSIMCYGEYRRADLVLATGVIEGACRYVVGERLDCSGMRWSLEGAEPVLQLRCIELNGDWERFIEWATTKASQELGSGKGAQIRRCRPKPSTETKMKRAA
jgi:hypothetical protein